MSDAPKLPETILYTYAPYTYGATLGSLEWATDHEGRRVLRGVFVSGTETSYLFHHRASHDIAGRPATVYAVRDYEIRNGHIQRSAS